MTSQQLAKYDRLGKEMELVLKGAGIILADLTEEQRVDLVDFMMSVFMEYKDFIIEMEEEQKL